MKNKINKATVIFTVFFLLFTSITAVLKAAVPAQANIHKNVLIDEQGKTIEEVMNKTEQKYPTNEQNQELIMSDERASFSNLMKIGQTASGNKIYSSASKEVVNKFIRNPQGIQNFSAANSGYVMYWNGTYGTPMIWMDGIGWVYCIEPYTAFPSGNEYNQGTLMSDVGLKAILAWGFPRNHGGQWGLSDEDAYLRTFVALNAYIGTYTRSTIESYGDSYVNMLLSKGYAQDFPTETYTVHEPMNRESYFNKATKRLETDLFEISGVQDALFWLENLPEGFYMIGEDGNRYDQLTIPGKFRVTTENLKYSSNITFGVKTNISPRAAIKYTSPGVQSLLILGMLDPLPAYGTSAIFKPATGGFKGMKDDTNGSFVNSAVFTLFHDKEGKEVVKDVNDNIVSVTTKNGVFEYPDNILTGEYWLHERKPDGSSGAPNGYWQMEQPIEVDIEPGKVVELPVITNIFKERVQLVIEKTNEYNKPVTNLIFDVYRKADELLVDTITTDMNGKAYSKFLPANRINRETGNEEKIEYYAVERQMETYIPIQYVDFDLTTKNDDDQVIVSLINYHLRLNVEGFKIDEEGHVLPGTLYGMYDTQGRQLAVTEVDQAGKFSFKSVRFDLFFNNTDKSAQYADVYIGEIQVVDEDKYSLDSKKYYLPNLGGKFNDYKMDDTISLCKQQEPFVNKFLRGELELVKVDETDDEKILSNTTFKFERLTGRDAVVDAEAPVDETNNAEAKQAEETDKENKVETPAIDLKQLLELKTDENGRIQQAGLLYGDWCVTEIKAAEGYVLPVDHVGSPSNKLCFTFNNGTRKVNLKFYNKKKPEVLVSTGNNLPEAFTLLGIAIILLSITLLVFVRINYRGKQARHAILGIIMLTGLLLGGTTFAAEETLETKPSEMLTTLFAKKGSQFSVTGQLKIDPIDGDDVVYDPIDRNQDNIIDDAEFEGAKSANEDKVSNEGNSLPNNNNHEGNSTTGKGAVRGSLASAGENNIGILIGVVIIVISTGVLFLVFYRRKKLNQK